MGARSKFSVALLLIVAFTAGILSATVGGNWIGAGDRIGTPSYAAKPAPAGPETGPVALTPEAAAFDDAFVEVADIVNPTVVQIRSEQVREQQMVNPFEGSPFENWFQMPNQGQPRTYRTHALGSGVIVRKDGYIITNYHVVRDADEMQVVLFDGSFHDAEIVGTDENSDLAVIRIDADDLPTVSFGSLGNVRVGEWVLAFGSPLAEELGNTVTSGIVSAVGRTSPNLTSLNPFSSFIQTDAAINPGNSGGPLVDLHGNLIGINSAIYSRSGGYQGVGFAIPVDVVQNVTRQLIESGSVERGFLGVNFDAVTQSLADAYGAPRGAAQITSVTKDTPAEKAGLQEGDLITAVNGHELRSAEELRTTVGNMAPGDRVELSILREGEPRSVSVELGRRSDFIEAATGTGPRSEGKSSEDVSALGMTLQSVTPGIAQQLGLPDGTTGVIVAAIDEDSEAFREAEMRKGDVIVEANREKVGSLADFQKAYRDVDSGDTFIVKVMRLEGSVVRTYFTALTRP